MEHIERVQREQAMLREIATKLNGALKHINADGNNDRYIDAFTIIVDNSYAQEAEWDNILWPHMSYAYEISIEKIDQNYYLPNGFYEEKMTNLQDKVAIDGLYLNSYNILTTGYVTKQKLSGDYEGLGNIGVLCHEFMHNLGLYDYYSYVDSTYHAVGEFDILGQTQAVPQMSLSYLRQKKGWLKEGENILPIESSGHYTLDAVTAENKVKAYKLVLNDYAQTGEYFMLEMRSNAMGGFDSMLSSSGLIVYRINEDNGYINQQGEYGAIPYGNMYGGKGNEEVYVYRAGCADDVFPTNSNKSLAILDGGEVQNGFYYDMSMIGSTDKTQEKDYFLKYGPGIGIFRRRYYNTTIHYGNGRNSGVAIKNITLSQDRTKVSFDIEFDDASGKVCDNDSAVINVAVGGKNRISWESEARKGKAYILVTKYDEEFIKFKNGKAYAKRLPMAEEMIKGQIAGYSTINHIITPISFKQTKIEQDMDGYAVFIMLDDGENQVVKFVGATKGQSTGIFKDGEYSVVIKWLVIGVCSMVAVIAIILMFAFFKKHK